MVADEPALLAQEGPNVARVYDFLLGGAHNFPADREAGTRQLATLPRLAETARINRQFLAEAVRYLVDLCGVRQFLDIGSGIPTMGNVHEVAHQQGSDARVVYVDVDPAAVAHSQILLAKTPAVAAIESDLRRPREILAHPTVRGLLDLSRPVAVLRVAVLHFIPDDTGMEGLVAVLRDVLPAGRYLVISHATGDGQAQDVADAAELYRRTTGPFQLRTHAELLRLFDGCDLVDPGLILLPGWDDDRQGHRTDGEGRLPVYAGLGRVR